MRNRKKIFLILLVGLFLLNTINVNIIYAIHGEIHDKIDKEKEKKKEEHKQKEKEKRERPDEERNKEKDEHIERMLRHEDDATVKEIIKPILRNAPEGFLETYADAGGKITFLEKDKTIKDYAKNPFQDIDGKIVNGEAHVAYNIDGKQPHIVVDSAIFK